MPRQSMDSYIQGLKKRKILWGADPDLRVSNKAFANRLLANSGLSQREKTQVYFNAGSGHDPAKIERVLRLSFPNAAETERKQGRATGGFTRPPQATKDRRPFRRPFRGGRPGRLVWKAWR